MTGNMQEVEEEVAHTKVEEEVEVGHTQVEVEEEVGRMEEYIPETQLEGKLVTMAYNMVNNNMKNNLAF